MRYILLVLLLPASAFGSDISIGPLGIDAVGLRGPGNELLNGAGVNIGQTEFLRPADPELDAGMSLANSTVNPTQVTVSRVTPSPGDLGGFPPDFDDYTHPTRVASVMIGTNGGVAPGAELYADAFVTINFTDQLLSQQFISRVGIGTEDAMRAINASWGHENGLGGVELALGFDWIASRYDVLNVMALNDDEDPDSDSPGNSFNGITVASAQRVDGTGQYRQLAVTNDVDTDFDVNEIELLAPGVGIEVAGLNNTSSSHNGSSFAAPHVVGTVALLQQYANLELARPGTTWDSTAARRHDVMKAVLLNSADKLAGVNGSTRTVIDFAGLSWEDSPANSDPEIPLDPYIGAGHLNAKRALKQFEAGQQFSSIAPLGWAYNETGGLGTFHTYTFGETLSGDVSITLAWDAVVDKVGADDSIYSTSDIFFGAVVDNLDLYLLPVGWTSLSEAVAASYSPLENVEHIFAQNVPSGDYEILVHQVDGNDRKYGLAWWFGDGPSDPIQGDFDEDGDVDGDDLTDWKSNFGTGPGADADNDGDSDGADFLAWQGNYGFGVPATPASVPEPSALMLGVIGLAALCRRR